MSEEGLRVIGAGFGRTGTLSTKMALERLLGGPCYHMKEIMERRRRHIPLWRAAQRGEAVDWQGLFKGYRATVDWPSITFYQQQMAAFPDAKVVLTVRDPERWYQSAEQTIYAASQKMAQAPYSWMLRLMGMYQGVTMAEEIVWQHHFGGRFEDKAHAIEVFNQHIEAVKAAVPPERLLVFRVQEGWGPLCAFLGLPEPDEPFPRSNDSAQVKRLLKVMVAVSWALPILAAAALMAGAFFLLG